MAHKRLRLYTVRDLIALLFQYTIKLIESIALSNPPKLALYIACVSGRFIFLLRANPKLENTFRNHSKLYLRTQWNIF